MTWNPRSRFGRNASRPLHKIERAPRSGPESLELNQPGVTLGVEAAGVQSAEDRETAVVEVEDLEPGTKIRARRPSRLGWLPFLAVCAAIGVAVCTAGDALSRSTRSSSQALFWIGLLVIFVPIVLRLLSRSAGRSERLSLVVLLGLALYLVKIVHDPFGFTFADELVHAHNANEIVRTRCSGATRSCLSRPSIRVSRV